MIEILFLAADLVWPPSGGGRIRTLSQLHVLGSLPEVARVVLFSLGEDGLRGEDRAALRREVPKLEVLEPVFHPVHLFAYPRYVPRVAWLRAARGVPYLAGKWESPAVRAALARELNAFRYDVVWLGSLGMARYLPLVRHRLPDARIVLDGHNVESALWGQFARRQRGIRRLVAEAEWRLARDFERDVLRAVDAVAAISTDDARAYRELAGVEARFVPQVVPFDRRATRTAGGARLCYVGTLSWRPNARGLDWFCGEVWPRVRERLPDATLEIAGAGLPVDPHGAAVAPRAWSVPGVTTVGFVPDVAAVYDRSVAMVAPTLGGSGVRLKLLEAFRHGVPVITTSDGAAGLAIEPGREAFVEDEPSAFAARVIETATSPLRQARLRDAAFAFLGREHGMPAAQDAVRDVLGLRAGSMPRGRSGHQSSELSPVDLAVGGRGAGVVGDERERGAA